MYKLIKANDWTAFILKDNTGPVSCWCGGGKLVCCCCSNLTVLAADGFCSSVSWVSHQPPWYLSAVDFDPWQPMSWSSLLSVLSPQLLHWCWMCASRALPLLQDNVFCVCVFWKFLLLGSCFCCFVTFPGSGLLACLLQALGFTGEVASCAFQHCWVNASSGS